MAIKTRLLQPDEVSLAAQFIKDGESVAFPTETVYGLGANALNSTAVNGIFRAKGRPQDNPLIIHCYDQLQLDEYVQNVPSVARELMQFWPGPLTLVLPKRPIIPSVVSAGLDTVAVRIPDHPLALALLAEVGLPVAAPSANVSGRPSPTKAEHVLTDLNGRIRAILDGGETGWGLESTVLDCTTNPPRLLRPGGVTLEELGQVCKIDVDPGVYGKISAKPRSPGMKYRHYAPNAEVILVVGEHTHNRLHELANSFAEASKQVGILTVTERLNLYSAYQVFDMGSVNNLAEISARLYSILREVDKFGIEVLLVEGIREEGLGMAIMNRLQKAAGNKVVNT